MFLQVAAHNADELDSTEVAAATLTPSMGELLYPGFNALVPEYVEHVIPHMASLSAKEASVMISSFFQLLDFAFRTHVFRQAQQSVVRAVHSSKPLQNLLASKSLIESANHYRPLLLDFVPKSKSMIAKRNKVAQSQSKRRSDQVDILPLYPVFKDRALQ